jgi:ATP-dependent DNA helicase RecQ
MLVGSRAQGVIGPGLDQLSTYGLLRAEGAAYVYELLREAERAGLVQTDTSGDYPLVGLTAEGEEVMRREGGAAVLRWPPPARVSARATGGGRRSGGSAGPRLEELGFDAALFDKLKALRARIARDEGGVPAYRVFENQTLECFARLKPTTAPAARPIRGVGPAREAKYLQAFLEAIREHVGRGGGAP